MTLALTYVYTHTRARARGPSAPLPQPPCRTVVKTAENVVKIWKRPSICTKIGIPEFSRFLITNP